MKKKISQAFISILLVFELVFGMLVPKFPVTIATAATKYQYNSIRSHMNFNREWKFYKGDITNAQSTEFNDSGWTNIGLPHDFSTPYYGAPSYYVGYGWYRKTFTVPKNWDGKRISIEFEGVFQEAEVYVNGTNIGKHEGGYTGFEYDITQAVKTGKNVIAVKVDNNWQADLTPRTGDHQFSGGIYRDVYLNVTNDVHVTWYGTFVTTPDLLDPDWDPTSDMNTKHTYLSDVQVNKNLENKTSNVSVQTEVKNESNSDKTVYVKQTVVDKNSNVVSEFTSPEQTIKAGCAANINAVSDQIKNIELWSPENPYVYQVYTTVYENGKSVDSYESPLGFRCVQWRNDGFYLNGKKTFLFGANVHQDHAGWANAVTDKAFYRDISMVKEAGMNFIRGSHYPHDPAFASSCDDLGVMLWSENVFWGGGGTGGREFKPRGNYTDWQQDTYPQNIADQPAFEDSVKQTLTDMIRINRNHPSIINWSMGNEVFFTSNKTQTNCYRLVNTLRNLSHDLDYTRKAAMGGVQRCDYDNLKYCDIAGYNGDGAKIINTSMPNIVSEYSSHTYNRRPDNYRPYFNDCQNGTDIYSYTTPNTTSAGIALWCAFNHGTIFGPSYGNMGFIDYARIPTRTWYWYRNKYNSAHPEPVQSINGTAAGMDITASQDTITNDGKQDTHIEVTMKNAVGQWVSSSPRVTLKVISGPGVFPTGKEMVFNGTTTGANIQDGKCATEFRSFYAGTTKIAAMSDNLPTSYITITTTDASKDESGKEPSNFMVQNSKGNTAQIPEPLTYGINIALKRPCEVSSNPVSRSLATDGNVKTSWVAGTDGSGQYFMEDFEGTFNLYKAKLYFNKTPYPYKIEAATDKSGPWKTIATYTPSTITSRPYEDSLGGILARYLKITFTNVPKGKYASLSELAAYGILQGNNYTPNSAYLSDLKADKIVVASGNAGKDHTSGGGSIVVGGKTYQKGLGFKGKSEADYSLNRKYTRFQAIVGIDSKLSPNGSATFKVYADDNLIYQKELKGAATDTIDLSVSGVNKIKIITDNTSDFTNWANAKLLGALRDLSNNNLSATLASNSLELVPGQNFEATLGLKNISNADTKYTVSLTLYNKNGKLVDVKKHKVNIAKGSSVSFDLSINIPMKIIGYQAKLTIINSDTSEELLDTRLN